MTFREACEVICAPYGTYDSAEVDKAIRAVHWYRDNILELEDYQTDELYKILDYLKGEE